jgi:hypothetical protein
MLIFSSPTVRALAVHTTAAFVLLGFALPAIAWPPTPSPQVPVLSWLPCGDDFPGAECAVARVPLDYGHPRGATTGIALARIPAANASIKIGTVFVNPGGPGGSGVDMVLFGFGDFLASLLGGRFDVVGFDPRGVASSNRYNASKPTKIAMRSLRQRLCFRICRNRSVLTSSSTDPSRANASADDSASPGI